MFKGPVAIAGLSLVLALVLLGLGFAIEMGPLGQWAGHTVALSVATLAAPLLSILGSDLIRTGVELRAVSGDWAVRVSEVCDGMGLVVALVAAVAATARPDHSLQNKIGQFAVGILTIQVFNLARVVVLALALERWPESFGLLHDHLFPMLTAFVIGCVLLPSGQILQLFALTAGLMVLWAQVASLASALLVPLANLALPMSFDELGEIALRDSGWSVGTYLLAGTDPVRLFIAPHDPQHFTLSMPILVAAILLTRQPIWLLLILPVMLIALTIAAPVAVWALAASESPVTVLRPDGSGAFTPDEFAIPETLRAVFRVIQNTLVHFLLLVLPFVMLSFANRSKATPAI